MNSDSLTIHDRLHALADGQLDAEQSRRLLAEVETNITLQKELCEIQRIKHLVKSAYPLPVMSSAVQPLRRRSPVWQQAAVYALVFGLTFFAGVGSHYLPRLWEAEGLTLDNAAEHDNRFIVFLDSHEPAKLESALVKAEHLAQQVDKKEGSVYVVTSAEGIDLLRLGTTQHANRIVQLSANYPHLRFVACSNTLYSFKQRGELVALVDEAEIAPSAVQFVVDHMRDGWRYIAI
jgi:intracellular sulfur oxidation DsrE/DsrF family protein